MPVKIRPDVVQKTFSDTQNQNFGPIYETVEDLFNGDSQQVNLSANSDNDNITIQNESVNAQEKQNSNNQASCFRGFLEQSCDSSQNIDYNNFLLLEETDTIVQAMASISSQELQSSESIDSYYTQSAFQEYTQTPTESYITQSDGNKCTKKSKLSVSNFQDQDDKDGQLAKSDIDLMSDEMLREKWQLVQASDRLFRIAKIKVRDKDKIHFLFPSSQNSKHVVRFSSSQQDLVNTLKVLGNDLSIGYYKSQELYDLTEKCAAILRYDHNCTLPSYGTFAFIDRKYLNLTDEEIRQLHFDFIVAGYKGTNQKSFCDETTYVFTTLREKEPDTKRIIVVTNPILDSKGNLRDINIGYYFNIKFFDVIEKCQQHTDFNCYLVHTLKDYNANIRSCGAFDKYRIDTSKKQSDYAKIMVGKMGYRIKETIKKARDEVKKRDE